MPRKKKSETSRFRNIQTFVVPTPEVIAPLKEHLLKLPLFKRAPNGDLILRPPEYSQTIVLKIEEGQLVWQLSVILGSFFRDIRIDAPSYSDTMTRLTMAQSELSSCKKDLTAANVSSEEVFNRVLDIIDKWRRSYSEHIRNPIPLENRTKLVSDLYTSFENCVPRFKNTARFYSIAHILKGFEIEEGDVRQIFDRVKKDYYRKKAKAPTSVFPPP